MSGTMWQCFDNEDYKSMLLCVTVDGLKKFLRETEDLPQDHSLQSARLECVEKLNYLVHLKQTSERKNREWLGGQLKQYSSQYSTNSPCLFTQVTQARTYTTPCGKRNAIAERRHIVRIISLIYYPRKRICGTAGENSSSSSSSMDERRHRGISLYQETQHSMLGSVPCYAKVRGGGSGAVKTGKEE